jgi:uncharacterized protein YjbI with pentapeptide repeats
MDRAEFTAADCQGARLVRAKIPYADFSHAILRAADFSGAKLRQAVLHQADDRGTNWKGADRTLAKYTDKDRAEAEDWLPPRPPET